MPGRTRMVVNVFSLLGAFLATALVLGILAAGLFIPAVGATGTAAKSGIDLFDSLPSDFTTLPLPQASRIYDAKGNLIATPYTENRVIVPLKSVAPIMQKAQVAIEDDRFYEHGGADLRGIARAAVKNAGNDDTQGASTLTQQYVKVTLFEQASRAGDKEAIQAAIAPTYSRKLQEVKYAVQVEKKLSKDQILENYLNLVFYGDGAYGVEAAAQHYFSVPASKLTLTQAALLAGVVQDPSRCDPRNNPECAQSRRDIVLDRMYQLGQIPAADWKAAKAVAVPKMLKIKNNRNNCANSTQQYFCQYVIEWLKTQPALGKTPAERLTLINTGGLVIRTTLDPELTAYATEQLKKKVYPAQYKRFGAAASMVEPGTGRVIAMAQSSDFKTYQVNWNVPKAMGGSTYGFGIGSTAKVYALIRALSTGTPVNGSIKAKSASPSKAAVYLPSEFKDECKPYPDWRVRNDFSSGGTLTLRNATANSINTAFASLGAKVGICNVRDTMKLMGVKSGQGEDPVGNPSDVILGSITVAPVTMAASYAALAAGGNLCEPVPVASVTTLAGKALKVTTKSCKQVISPEVAAGVTELLTGVIKNGTGTGARLSDGREAAGKTGTDEDHNESWFTGYTPQRALAVWVGTPLGNTSATNMNGVTIGGQYYSNVFGGTIAAPLWSKIMSQGMKDLPRRSFAEVSDKIQNGDLERVPAVAGLTVAQATQKITDAGFQVANGGETDNGGNVPKGRVAFATPGSRAPKGDTITIYISKGPQAQTPPAGGDQPTGNRGRGGGNGRGNGPVTPPNADD